MNNIEKKVLPSNGLIEGIPREVEIRGMKGREISTLFSSLTDAAIDNIIKSVTTPSLDPDELCDEDKLYILHQTRVLTFGNEVEQTLRCPACGMIQDHVFNYEDFDFTLLEEEKLKEEFTLSDGETVIKRRIVTQDIIKELARYKEKFKLPDSYAFILLQAARIGKVDGKKKSTSELIEFLNDMQGKDLIKLAKFLDFNFGLNTNFKIKCTKCQFNFEGGIGINADLFREPDISI